MKSGKESCSTARREFAALNAYRAHTKRECVPLGGERLAWNMPVPSK